jgi:hypothetical protein
MKSWKVWIFVLVFGIVFLGFNGNGSNGVYAQSNNDAQIIGIWQNASRICKFNPDGTFELSINSSVVLNGNYFVNSTNVFLKSPEGRTVGGAFYLSSNGKVLVLNLGVTPWTTTNFDNNFTGLQWFDKQ